MCSGVTRPWSRRGLRLGKIVKNIQASLLFVSEIVCYGNERDITITFLIGQIAFESCISVL